VLYIRSGMTDPLRTGNGVVSCHVSSPRGDHCAYDFVPYAYTRLIDTYTNGDKLDSSERSDLNPNVFLNSPYL